MGPDLGAGKGKDTPRASQGGMLAWHWGVGLKSGLKCSQAPRMPPGASLDGSKLGSRLAGSEATWAGIKGMRFDRGGRLQTPCPAQVAPVGPGCPWTGGASSLDVAAPAWLGGTYRARAAGLPPQAVVASVYGTSQQVTPLWSLLPMTAPGCLSYTSGDFVLRAAASGGALVTEQPLPVAAALVGTSLYHQLVVFELDAAGACVSVSASNALELTLGVF